MRTLSFDSYLADLEQQHGAMRSLLGLEHGREETLGACGSARPFQAASARRGSLQFGRLKWQVYPCGIRSR